MSGREQEKSGSSFFFPPDMLTLNMSIAKRMRFIFQKENVGELGGGSRHEFG